MQGESQRLDQDEPVLAEQEQSASTAVSEPKSAPHDQVRKLHEVTERFEICSNPNADRNLTLDEKSKLSACIASLDGDQLGQVLEVVMQEEPDLPGMFCSPCSLLFIWSCTHSLTHSFYFFSPFYNLQSGVWSQ